MTIYPIPIIETYPFTAEKSITRQEKEQLLLAWQRLMLSGFKNLFFTEPLYRFFVHHSRLGRHKNREQFWHFYMNSSSSHFRAFLAEFGGDRQGRYPWLDGPAADLKEAICRETARLYAPLSQVLQDLEKKHQETMAAWRDVALAANITDAVLPPAYQVNENTRHLLAYVAYITLLANEQ